MNATNIIIRKRITKLFLFVGAVLFLLIGRLGWIQFVRGEDLGRMAIENRMDDVPVPAKRGTIYDRNGKELVVSVSSDSVMAFPPDIKRGKVGAENTARQLADLLGLDYKEVLNKINQKRSSVWIKRGVELSKSKLVRQKNLPGIEVYEESRRSYPNGKLAAHVLGFVGTDNTGLNGIEMSMNRELAGTSGRIVSEKDAAGREIPQATHKYIEPIPGKSLVLNLDETIQFFAERELDKVVEQYKPKNATIIVMDPKTGGILAMANRPDFDPGEYRKYPTTTWRNNAIWMNYEPGSTFKIITTAAALEEGVVKPESRFYDPGFIMVADRRIKCWRFPRAHGAQSFVEVVQNSCNPGFVKIGLDLGRDKFYKYIRAFGFGEKTGITLAGESKGIVIPEKSVKPISIATMSIGQSISVTPIQLLTAVSAVANQGVLLKPHLVKEIRSESGVERIESEVVKEVISKSTAKQLAGILEKVVSPEGTGANAYLEEYRMAGKTGTAQKAGPGGYQQGKYVASFAGFGPVDNPQIAALVVIDEPSGGAYYGGQLAAPVFKDLVRDVLRYMNVPPQVSPEKVKDDPEKQEVMVPDIVNTSLDEAGEILEQSGLKARVEGSGLWIIGQQPKAGGRVKINTQVILYAGSDAKEVPAGQEVTMPDVTGLTMRETGRLLGRLGLKLDPQGSGVAVSQKTVPGTKIRAGSAVTVEFEPPSSEAGP